MAVEEQAIPQFSLYGAPLRLLSGRARQVPVQVGSKQPPQAVHRSCLSTPTWPLPNWACSTALPATTARQLVRLGPHLWEAVLGDELRGAAAVVSTCGTDRQQSGA